MRLADGWITAGKPSAIERYYWYAMKDGLSSGLRCDPDYRASGYQRWGPMAHNRGANNAGPTARKAAQADGDKRTGPYGLLCQMIS